MNPKISAYFESRRRIEKGSLQYSVFRVPTLYAPWQPSFMMFHQLILSELGEKECRCTIEEKGMIYFTLKMYVNTYGKMERTGASWYIQFT